MSSPILVIEGPNFSAGLGIGQDFVYVPDVSSLRGSNSIESLVTVGLSLKTIVIVSIGGGFQSWQLTTGNADGVDPENSVQPLDYDTISNDVHWQCIGKFKSGLVGSLLTRAGAQGIDSGIDDEISFDSPRFNSGEWDVTAPTRFTCITPGVYAVYGSISFAPNSGGQRNVYIRKNGGSHVAADVRAANASGSTIGKASALVYLLTGDYLELVVNQTSGSSLDAQKLADYSPEFSAIWIGSSISQAVPTFGSAGGGSIGTITDVDPPTVTQSMSTTDVGWYRIYEGIVPSVGGFSLRRVDNSDAGALDIEIQFGVFGSPNTGVIQVPKNTQNAAIQALDAVRVSYESTNAYVDVHLTLAGEWEITRPNRDGYVAGPFVAPTAGSGGSKQYNVLPNVTGSTEPIDVPRLTVDGIKIAQISTDGWVAPTGTVARTTFDQSTVTLPELAKRVAALVTDQLTFGSIRVGLPSSMTYADMLLLAANLVVENTTVPVTDIFTVTAAPTNNVLGIYIPFGTANGHSVYRMQGYLWNTALTRCIRFGSGTAWEIYGPAGVLYRSNAPASPAQPWNVTQWENLVPTNVAITTVAPNIPLIYNALTDTHTAVYGTYAADGSWNGVYRYVDIFNTKRRYYLYNAFGGTTADNRRIEWNGTAWEIKSDSGIIFSSAEAVTYPDQVTTWLGSGDSSISLARMDAVDLASGVVISGGGSDTDGLYIPQLGNCTGAQPIYRRMPDGTRFLNADGTRYWWITATAGGFGSPFARSYTFGKYPWEASWLNFSLIAQQKKTGGPTNWHV